MRPPRPSGTTPTRRPRLSDAETAERMLAAAVAQVERDGVRVSFEGISMERVIEEAGVSRASAYRRWPTRQDFLTDVLVATANRPRNVPEDEAELSRLFAIVSEHLRELGTAQGRRDAVVAALRVASDADLHRLLGSRAWQNHLALAATQGSLPDGELRRSVGHAIAQAERRLLDARAEVYAHLPAVLGYRLVPPLEGAAGFRVMSSAAGVTMTGILLRSHCDPQWLTDRTPLRPFGSSRTADWSMPELHLVGAFLSHLEPDPDLVWAPARVEESLRLLHERAEAARAARGDDPAAAHRTPGPGARPRL